METKLKNGIKLHVFPTEKYKTTVIKIRLTAPLEKKASSQRTLLASLLETNSRKYPTQRVLSEKLADLYGANFGITTNKKGNKHYFTVILNMVNERFLPQQEPLLSEAVAFLKEIIFSPNLEGDAFDSATFYREQKNLASYIASVYDDKQSQASLGLQQLYFEADAAQSTPGFGTVEDVQRETPSSLYQYYQQMLREDEVDVLISGAIDTDEVIPLFEALPFNARISESSSDFYRQPLFETVKEQVVTEKVVQSKLNLAYQTNCYFHQQDYFPLQVLNGLFGGFAHSKLFINVREKASLAYYASSSIDTFRGLMTVQTGIEAASKERVVDLVQAQLASIAAGDISDMEMYQTKELLKNQYLLSLDNPSTRLEAAYLASRHPASRLSDESWVKAVDQVDVSTVQALAGRIRLQAVYFMEGEGQ